MEKKMQFSNINVANNVIPMINVDSLPNYKVNNLCAKKEVSQILYKDAYWVSVQDIILAEAKERNIQGIDTANISCVFDAVDSLLQLELTGSWSLDMLQCINAALSIANRATCISPGDGIIDITIDLNNDILEI